MYFYEYISLIYSWTSFVLPIGVDLYLRMYNSLIKFNLELLHNPLFHFIALCHNSFFTFIIDQTNRPKSTWIENILSSTRPSSLTCFLSLVSMVILISTKFHPHSYTIRLFSAFRHIFTDTSDLIGHGSNILLQFCFRT